MRLVADDSSARSGVRIMLVCVLSVNGEAVLDESIDAMQWLVSVKMFRCLNEAG